MSKMLVYFECGSKDFLTVMQGLGPSMDLLSELRIETTKETIVDEFARYDRVVETIKHQEEIYNTPRVNAGRKRPADRPKNRLSVKDPNWKNDTNSKVQARIISFLSLRADLTATKDELTNDLCSVGFAYNSLSPALTYMHAAKLITRNGDLISLVQEVSDQAKAV